MLIVALQTLRSRWAGFLGTFVALALGVALLTATGLVLNATVSAPARAPQRYAAVPTVVTGYDQLRVETTNGVDSQPLGVPSGVPAEVIDGVRRLDPGAVLDRTFYAQLVRDGRGGGARTGHPWPAAALTPYQLVDGTAPGDDGEIVAGTDAGVAVGASVPVLTVAGVRDYRVSGLVRPVPFESALFFSEAEAARISPRVDAVATSAGADAVTGVVGATGGRVLHGDGRREADPDRAADAEALVTVNAIVGTSAGIAGFVAIFVVASTFSFAVVQRRREFGLLRVVGLTPGQVRRMVYTEALAVGLVAAAAGVWLGRAGAAPLGRWMTGLGLAPPWFTVGPATWPMITAFAIGVLVALAGVAAASARAGRVRPVEALRDAAVEGRAMTPVRWLAGLLFLSGGLYLMLSAAATDPESVVGRKWYTTVPMLLLVAFGLLAPALVPPVVRLVGLPLRAMRGAGAMVVRQSALTAARRTASTAAPVMLAVGLTGSLLGATATIDAAKATERRERIAADFVVLPRDTPGLSETAVARVRAVPGADVLASRATTLYVVEGGETLLRQSAEAVDPGALGRVALPPVAAGSLAGLDDGAIAVNAEWDRAVGDEVAVWRADGSAATLRVVAVLDAGISGAGVYVTPANAPAGLTGAVYVKAHPGTDTGALRRALAAATDGLAASVTPMPEWAAATAAKNRQTTVRGLQAVLGVTLLYTAIAIVNTLLMAVAGRSRDLAVFRLSGATRAQALRTIAGESLVVVAVGVALAAGAAALNLAGMWLSVVRLVGFTSIAVPWAAVAAVAGICAVLALVASIMPAYFALVRRRAISAAAARE
ncbi:ABC transporter permease [Catenuloplanes indicus]|uniref:ABC transport system permease protein n=1 Tax=Catenuloplanes indicus TaxID=137267 RepID=A0AAE3VU77_9ACTN|nr:ABC transporter permease [Catenuloplanes indicus]MDQ0363906.1 putative ABC transport system permease protein [Catenuloplanes indicus]